MVDFAPTSLFKQQEEVYKLVYAPAILPRGVRVDGEHIAGQTEVGAPQMTLKKWYSFSSNVNLIQLLRYNSVRTYPLVILVMVVCPTKIFLSDFFYSGALLVH
mgnify:FL=1